jgi:hypothetical protein
VGAVPGAEEGAGRAGSGGSAGGGDVRRQVHTSYRGRSNRKFRKVINLRLSQFRRANGIEPWERLTMDQYLKAVYTGVFAPMKVSFSGGTMFYLIAKIPMEAAQ